MSAVPKPRITAAEYLAFEETALDKHEYYDGSIFAMAGTSRHHNELTESLGFEVFSQLRGGPCRTFSSDMRVKVSRTGLYTYPDRSITCEKPEFETVGGLDTLLNPQVIFEVLSPSTEAYDRGKMFLQYQKLPSLREYILICQDRVQVEQFVRPADPDAVEWDHTLLTDLASELVLTSAPVRLPLSELYRNVDLPQPPQ